MAPSPQKVALVTGAARGIGLATAKRFLAEGWRVALLDIENDLLKSAVAALATPEHTLALHCDVSDAKAVAATIDKVATRFGRLDALVNNGGGAIVNITSISAVRASTLRSAYGTSKAGLAHLTKQLAVELASLGIRVNA